MSHATTFRPHPVLPGVPCTITVIVLDVGDGPEQVLRVEQDGRAVGYFHNPDEAAAHGVDLATAEIRGGPR